MPKVFENEKLCNSRVAKKMCHLIGMERHTNTEWRRVIPATHGSWHTCYVRMSLEKQEVT